MNIDELRRASRCAPAEINTINFDGVIEVERDDLFQSIELNNHIADTDSHCLSDEVVTFSNGCLHHVYLSHASPKQFIAPTNLVCITLYNESVDEFAVTLRALLVSLQDFDTAHFTIDRASSCVCIVADGNEKLSPSIKAMLNRCGLWSEDSAARLADTVLHFSSHYPSALLAEINGHTNVQPRESPIHFVVCVKPQNRGKLDSHALFFGHVCEQLQPTYCYQLDTGTAIHHQAMRAMVEQLQTQLQVGALASRVVPPAPALGEGLLHSWQFLDFATQFSYCWPSELATGHLSVLPGQFCAFRWAALCPTAIHKQQITSPVQRYLRGINPSTQLEKLMFLAEDRVIGNEIVLDAHHNWRLDYCNSCHAITDPCINFKELLLQRRRWNNSSTACRVWLLSRWPAQLLRADRTPTSKLRFSGSMLWQLMLIIQQVFAPAATICMWALLCSAVAACGTGFAMTMIFTAASAAALEFYTPKNLSPRAIRIYAGFRDMAGCTGLVLSCIALATAFGWQAMCLVMLPAVLAVTATATIFNQHRWTILRRFAEYWALSPIIQIVLWVYALLHLDDLSWGTKGLTRAHADAANAKRMGRLKIILFTAWSVVNLAMIWLGLATSGWLIGALSPVVEMAQLALLLTILLSTFFMMKRRWWPPVTSRLAVAHTSGATMQRQEHVIATRH